MLFLFIKSIGILNVCRTINYVVNEKIRFNFSSLTDIRKFAIAVRSHLIITYSEYFRHSEV